MFSVLSDSSKARILPISQYHNFILRVSNCWEFEQFRIVFIHTYQVEPICGEKHKTEKLPFHVRGSCIFIIRLFG